MNTVLKPYYALSYKLHECLLEIVRERNQPKLDGKVITFWNQTVAPRILPKIMDFDWDVLE